MPEKEFLELPLCDFCTTKVRKNAESIHILRDNNCYLHIIIERTSPFAQKRNVRKDTRIKQQSNARTWSNLCAEPGSRSTKKN